MLRPSGGVIDDLIAYFLTDNWFRLVVNAGTRRKDLEWLAQQAAPFGVSVRERADLAILAVQGPLAREKTASLLSAAHRETALGIARFSAAAIDSWFLARTGYTGEDGFEILLPAGEAAAVWRSLVARGVTPAGLGRAGHAAPGSGHEPLRQRHGREPPSAGVGTGLDGGIRARGARLHRPRRARARARRRAATRWWAWCSRSAACCATTSPCSPSRRPADAPAPGSARSPAALFLRP